MSSADIQYGQRPLSSAAGAAFLRSRYSPLPYLARMFVSPISTHEALWTMRSMMASAWMSPPSLACRSFCWNCVQKIVEASLNRLSIVGGNLEMNISA